MPRNENEKQIQLQKALKSKQITIKRIKNKIDTNINLFYTFDF